MKPSLYRWVVAFLIFFAACSGGRGDPTSTGGGTGDLGGSLSSGKNGTNIAVVDPNRLQFSLELLKELYPSFLKAISVTAAAPSSTNEIRVLGNFQGYAVAASVPDTSGSSITVNQFEITYFDYSESGKIFFGGKVSYSGSFSKSGTIWIPGRMIFNSGGLAFAGSYSGTITFDNFRLFFDAAGATIDFITAPNEVICPLPLQGNLNITSGSGTLRFNPYYRLCIGG